MRGTVTLPVIASRTAYPLLALAVVAGVATLGFFIGPLAALGAVGAGVLLIGGKVAVQTVGEVRDARPREAATPAAAVPVPEDDTVPFHRGLGWVVGLAVLVRCILVVGINGTTLWGSFAPDAVYWQLSGEALLAHWSDPAVPLTQWFGSEDARPFYAVFNAIVVAVFGTARYPASFINTLVCIGAAYNFGRLAQMLFGRAAGRRTFVMGLFFPSVILWSSMNIREVWSFVVLSFALLSAHRLRNRVSVPDAAILLGSFVAMYFIRSYLAPILVLGVALSYLVVRVRQLPYALVALALIAVFAQTVGPQFGLDPKLLSEDSLQQVDQMRRNLAFGGSAYGADADTSTVGGSIAYLPEGITRFLMAPFPWSARSWRQMLTIPESFVWYYVLGLALWSIVRNVRTNFGRVAPSFFVLLLITGAYGLVSGNEGTAYRHRAQVMMIFFVFASAMPMFGRRPSASPPR